MSDKNKSDNRSKEGNALSNVPPPTDLPSFVQPQVTPVSATGRSLPASIDLAVQLSTDFNQVPEPDLLEETTVISAPQTNSSRVLNPPSHSKPLSLGSVASDPKEEAKDAGAQDSYRAVIPDPPDNDGFNIGGNVMPGSALLSWMKDAVATGGILHKVAEKAKNSVDTVITTLDPQMKEYIRTGGDTFVVVASDKDVKVVPVRHAFQTAFGKANVVGYPAQSDVTAAQPVGYAAAYAAAKQRIAHVRSTHAQLPENAPVVAIEAFIHEAVPDKWYDISLLVLSQPTLAIELQVQSQGTPVPGVAVATLRTKTPADYAHAKTGFSETIGAVMAEQLKVPPPQWQEAYTGVSRMELLTLAAKSLAVQYKRLLDSMTSSET